MSTIQILDRKTLSDKKYPLQNIKYEQPDHEGKMHDREKEVYFRPDAVAVLLVDVKAKKLLLTRQFRLPAFLNGNEKGYLIEAIAGIMDEIELPEETARREVMEETGYELESLEKFGGVYTSVGGITEFVHLFTGTYTSDRTHATYGGLMDEGEDIELIEMTFDEAREKLNRHEFIDAKTVILLQNFCLNRDL